jgi:DNA-binding protein YbaB
MIFSNASPDRLLNLMKNMKTKLLLTIATIILLPVAGFTQPPPIPPNPPSPPAPPNQPGPPDRHEKMPKVPVTFLGVETSGVPPVVSDQLGLAKGFGLVVDYIVPDGPAAAAGVQQNDILKMLNDQILTEPRQLEKLVRSYSEGTNITLTVLRKGQEQKITVKLAKKEVPQRHSFGPKSNQPWDFNFGDQDFGDLRERMDDLKDQLGDANQGMIHDAVMQAHEEADRAREQAREEAMRARDQAHEEVARAQEQRNEAQQARDEAQRVRNELQRARDEARRAQGMIKITKSDANGLKTTKIDLGKAQIVCSDDKGELRIDTADGKRILTAKDPKGLLLFSGPVETKEDIDKIPAAVRERFEKLQEKDLPSVSSDENDEDDDSADMDEGDDETSSVEQVSVQSFPRNIWTFRTLLI